MGAGNLGVNLSFTDAKQLQFSFTDVTNDSVVPLDVGNYLRNAAVDNANLILQQYVLGNGELFLVTKIAKYNKFSVKFEKGNGIDASAGGAAQDRTGESRFCRGVVGLGLV